MRTSLPFSPLIAVAFLMAVPTARAQPPGSYGPSSGVSAFFLARIKSVQRELKATPDQARRLDALAQEMQKRIEAEPSQLRDLETGPRIKKAEEMQRARKEDFRKALAGILKPEQAKRLEQIAVQQLGFNAFSQSPEVLGALKLTDDQKARIKEINDELVDAMLELSRTAPRTKDFRKNAEESRRRAIPAREKALKQAVGTLTDEQKAVWKDRYGEPFVVVVE